MMLLNTNSGEKNFFKFFRSQRFKEYVRTYALFIIFIFMCIILAFASETFLAPINIINVFRQISINGILALGMTFVIILGGIDISIGSVAAVAGVVASLVLEIQWATTVMAVIAGILAGGVMGMVIGFLVAKMRIAPFIASLAMMTIARGLALVIAGGVPHTIYDEKFVSIGNGYLWPKATPQSISLPISVLIFIICIILVTTILYKTKFGRYVYAVGGNEDAARVSGVKVAKIKFFTFVLNGLLCGVAGIVLAARITSGQPAAAAGYELDAIAAVIIGGASLSGGAGKVGGTIIGALIIGVLNNGLVLLAVSSYYQQIIQGIIIAGAVILDSRTKRM
jgi:ribose/xylose/arabinose/galactoside ABC-type transport system permease subunit